MSPVAVVYDAMGERDGARALRTDLLRFFAPCPPCTRRAVALETMDREYLAGELARWVDLGRGGRKTAAYALLARLRGAA